ncbi:probable peptide chain release factor C12orf65, mitochondrial [Nasonia vitripennis]|uniref:Prokaryotic-type class I peptide chain release factors domain-containing protein n=1 Tax=Nasonia vitripennis TaxID=7425 RepID=A0A7M7LMA3_NASVI|nr:probable peptide chain release factor C12orf65, mitochondrial [Nasonia vitripennis]
MLGKIFQKHCGTQLLYDFTNRAVFASAQQSYSMKSRIDTSKVPKINEDDLEIQYVRGSGPGGQSTNKTSNNVVMKHLPTGLVIKCHETRSQTQNLKIAKEKLINKLDLLYNGEDAVENQKKKLLAKKTSEKQRRQKKRAALKASFKESLENEEDAKKDE